MEVIAILKITVVAAPGTVTLVVSRDTQGTGGVGLALIRGLEHQVPWSLILTGPQGVTAR